MAKTNAGAKIVPMPSSKGASENHRHAPGESIQAIATALQELRDVLDQNLTTEVIDQRIIQVAQLIGKHSLSLKEGMGSAEATEMVIEPATNVLLELVGAHQDVTFYTLDEVISEIAQHTVSFDAEMEALNNRLDELCGITGPKEFRAALPDLLQALFDKGITRPIWDADERKRLPDDVWEKTETAYITIVDGNIDRIVAADPCKIGRKRLREILNTKKREYVESKQAKDQEYSPSKLADVLNRCERKDINTRNMAAMAAEFAAAHYAFFQTTDRRGYVEMDVESRGSPVCVQIDLSPNSPFWVELSRAGCLPDISTHRAVARAILFGALRAGDRVHSRSWLDSSANGSVLLHPHDGRSRVWMVRAGAVEAVHNGTNPEKIFVTTSPLMNDPIEVEPSLSREEAIRGIEAFRELLVRTAACAPENQNLIAAWFLSAPVRRRYSTRAQIAGHGDQDQGKTSAPTQFNALSYGDRKIADLTAAAAHVLRSVEPIIYGDDEEEQDLTEPEKRAHRRAATGAERVMRDASSADGLVIQPAQNLRWTNGITPMDNNPDRSRTLVVLFDVKQWGQSDYDDSKVTREIIGKRGRIWSALLQLLAHEMLPRLENTKEQDRVRALLRGWLTGHPKKRLLDHLVVMHTALASLNAWVPFCADVDEEARKWIESQAVIEQATSSDTDDIIAAVTLVAQRVLGKPPQDVQAWQVKKWVTGDVKGLEEQRIVGWSASSAQLAIMIAKARKDAGIVGRPPFKNAGSLGSKLGNSVTAGTFAASGWHVAPPDKSETSAKRAWTLIPPREAVGEQVGLSAVLDNDQLRTWKGGKPRQPLKKEPIAKARRPQGGKGGGKVAGRKVE